MAEKEYIEREKTIKKLEGGKLMYDELVTQLRDNAEFLLKASSGCLSNSFADTMCQAADAIEQLTADLERSKEWEAFWEREANEALKKFQTTVARTPRWIPVEKRLPEPETDVLSFRIYGSFSQMSEVIMNDMKKNGEWCYEGVTHWMPLPEPPKEG